MNIIDSFLSLFRAEPYVRIGEDGKYIFEYHSKLVGRLIRWIRPGEYMDLSTLWKAHREANKILKDLKRREGEAERAADISRLHNFREEVAGLSEDNKELKDLINRVSVVLFKIDPCARFLPSELIQRTNECIAVLLDPDESSLASLSQKIRSWDEQGVSQVAQSVSEQIFSPVVYEACEVMKQKNLGWNAYHEAFLKVKPCYDVMVRLFGSEAPARVLEQSGMFLYTRDNFLLQFYKEKILTSEPDSFVQAVNDLSRYVEEVETVFARFQQTDALWRTVQEGFAHILTPLFSSHKKFKFKRAFTLTGQPSFALPQTTSIKEDSGIRDWLRRLNNPEAVVESLSSRLAEGVYVGSKFVTDASLGVPFLTKKEDGKFILCWKFFEKLLSYYSDCGVANPMEAACSFLALSTPENPDHSFLPNMSKFAGIPLSSDVIFPRDESKRKSLAFSCLGSEPFLQWVQPFSGSNDSFDNGFFVKTTVRRKGGQVITKMETDTWLPSGEKLHIDARGGKYKIRENDFWSKWSSSLWFKKIYPLTAQGIEGLLDRIDEDVDHDARRTALSLYKLRRNIVLRSSARNESFPQDHPLYTLMAKIEEVKKQVDGGVCQDIGRMDVQKRMHPDFLKELGRQVIHVFHENIGSKEYLDGFFAELKLQFPGQAAELEKKRIATLDLVGEKVFQHFTKKEADSLFLNIETKPQYVGSAALLWAYNALMRIIEGFLIIYPSGTQDDVEKFYIEKHIPILALLAQKAPAQDWSEEQSIEHFLNSLFQIMKIFPFPHRPLFKGFFAELKKNKNFSPRIQTMLARVGSMMGAEIAKIQQGADKDKEVLTQILKNQQWVSRAFATEESRVILDSMRRTCGVRYGMALAGELKGFHYLEYMILQEQEYAHSPIMFPNVMRGVLAGIERSKSSLSPFESQKLKEYDAFCSHVKSDLVKSFLKEPIDAWFEQRFKIFVCAPFSDLSKKILSDVVKALFETFPDKIEAFSQKFSIFLLNEVGFACSGDTSKGTDLMKTCMKVLFSRDLNLPEPLKKKINKSIKESPFNPGQQSPRR